jgi:hypothetical protein
MRINELIVEGYYSHQNDDLQFYGAGKQVYIDNLVKNITNYIDSIRKTGQTLDMWTFTSSYLKKYGWMPGPEQMTMLRDLCKEVDTDYNYFLQKAEKQPQQQAQQPQQAAQPASPGERIDPTMEGILGNAAGSVGQWIKGKAGMMAGSALNKLGLGSITKLANAIYTVGMTQNSTPSTKASAGQTADSGTVDNPVLTKPTTQILTTMKNMKGDEGYKDDLESIVRLALTNLYKTDPGDYSAEVKRIMGQKPTQNTQNPQV